MNRRPYNKENNPNWKGGLPKCIICGKQVSSLKTKKCQQCYLNYNVGENNSNFKGGKPHCPICDKILSYKGIYCTHCAKLGDRHHAWRGGKHINNGYVYILKKEHPYATKNGHIFEHRLVMESIIGRYLKPEEIVHHINFIRNDNRPENLYLFKNLKEHNESLHSLYKLVNLLLQTPNSLKFKDGVYYIDEKGSNSSISDPLASDKQDKEGQDTPDSALNQANNTQPIDTQEVKDDKIDDKNLVTGTPVKSIRKRGRPKKLPKPEDLTYGKSENEAKQQNSERKED